MKSQRSGRREGKSDGVWVEWLAPLGRGEAAGLGRCGSSANFSLPEVLLPVDFTIPPSPALLEA